MQYHFFTTILLHFLSILVVQYKIKYIIYKCVIIMHILYIIKQINVKEELTFVFLLRFSYLNFHIEIARC